MSSLILFVHHLSLSLSHPLQFSPLQIERLFFSRLLVDDILLKNLAIAKFVVSTILHIVVVRPFITFKLHLRLRNHMDTKM